MTENLKSRNVLDFMTEQDQKRLIACGHLFEFKEKRCLFIRGEEGSSFYIILAGSVVFSINSAMGKEVVLNTLSAGEVFGEIAMFDQGERTTDAYALKGTKVVAVNRSQLFDFLDKKPVLYKGIINLLCHRLRWCAGQVESFAFSDSFERLIAKLLYLARVSGQVEKALLETSQSDLAKKLGLSREVVNRNLRDLQARGVLRLERNKIIIPQIKELEAVQKQR